MNNSILASRVEQIKNDELSNLMSLIGKEGLISFAGGIPNKEVFPEAELKNIIDELIGERGNQLFQYSSTSGCEELKEYIAEFLKQRDIACNTREIIITTGSQQGLDLLSKIFIDPGDKVIVEDPSYVGGIGAFKSYEADIIPIPVDDKGMKMAPLESKLEKNDIKFVYIVSDHSNPAGMSLGLERRKKLLELAEKYNFYILEDTPYRELSYYHTPYPTIKSMDQDGGVICLGSFSKFFVPGFRVAYVCADEEVIKLLNFGKQNTVLASNTMGQQVITRAGKKGLVEKQIEKVKPYYKKRLEAMGEALEQYFPASTDWHEPEGGFFYWVELPSHINSKQLLKKAIASNVAFVNGNAFFSDYKKGDRYMRLSFSCNSLSEINDGIKKLADIIRKY